MRWSRGGPSGRYRPPNPLLNSNFFELLMLRFPMIYLGTPPPQANSNDSQTPLGKIFWIYAWNNDIHLCASLWIFCIGLVIENNPPEIKGQLKVNATLGQSLNLSADAFDPDGDLVTVISPDGNSTGSGTANISYIYTPTAKHQQIRYTSSNWSINNKVRIFCIHGMLISYLTFKCFL